jgi:hypothetical protein
MAAERNSSKICLWLACLSLMIVSASCGSGGNAIISNIQKQSNWQACTGPTCAGGNGNATYSITQGESSPSLDGAAAEFQIGGSTGYSNVKWTRTFPATDSATQFTLDLQAYLSDPSAPQAISFGVSQIVGSAYYSFKFQCDFKNTGTWQVWDAANQAWAPTGTSCTLLPAGEWIHFVFQVERTNSNQLHYKQFSINAQINSVDLYFNPSVKTPDALVVHVDEDGDSAQDPYSVWLDAMTLTYH